MFPVYCPDKSGIAVRMIRNTHKEQQIVPISFRQTKSSAVAVTVHMNTVSVDILTGLFLLDGRIEISNNHAENAIRLYGTGRKNWLFAVTARGAKASAIVYSIIESAKANQLNPYMYLVHLMSKLPSLKGLTHETLTPFLPWSPELPYWCHKDSNKAPQD